MIALLVISCIVTARGFTPTPTTTHAPEPTPTTTALNSASSATPDTKAAWGTFIDGEDADTTSLPQFTIPKTELLRRAAEILSPEVGIGTKDGGACLSPDFEFVAAVVGPIGREEYLSALGSFNLEDGFDIIPNFYGMSVDPMQPNRVWFFNRVTATHTGTFMGAEPSGKEIVYPPQVHHLDFDEDGKVREYGFYTADRRQGNTGGLGGAFGFMWAVGKPLPIPECQPYKKSFRFRMLSFVGGFLQKLQKKED